MSASSNGWRPRVVALDVDGTVAQVTGFTLNPAILADRLFGDNEVSPVLAVDDATFDKSAEAAAKAGATLYFTGARHFYH